MDIKNLFILGDSYSTFEGKVPEGNCIYYYKNQDLEKTDVHRYEDTWVSLFLEKVKCNLVLNESSSGATICNTGYGGTDSPKSFIRRLKRAENDGVFQNNNVDTMIIMGGTNDSWANSPLGKVKFENITDKDLFNVFEGMSYLINRVRNVLKIKNILFVINTKMIKPEIVSAYKEILNHYEIPYTELLDFNETNGHPTIKGMKTIADTVVKAVENN